MALNANAIFTAATGYVYIGTVGTAAMPTPASIAAFDPGTGLGAGWDQIGHTSREELPEFGFDGGETETRGSWQNASLKVVTTEAPVDYVTFNLHQFDEAGLSLYYGQANSSTTADVFGVANTPLAGIEKALCIVMVDGTFKIAFHSAKSDIRREGAITLAVDEFSTLPLRATFLQPASGDLYSWIGGSIDV
jgi:hypothetical protein